MRLFGRLKGCSRTVTETGCAALAEAAREDLPWCEIVHSYSHDSPRELKVAGDAAGAVSLAFVVTKPLPYRALGDVVGHSVSVSIRVHLDDWQDHGLFGDREALATARSG